MIFCRLFVRLRDLLTGLCISHDDNIVVSTMTAFTLFTIIHGIIKNFEIKVLIIIPLVFDIIPNPSGSDGFKPILVHADRLNKLIVR